MSTHEVPTSLRVDFYEVSTHELPTSPRVDSYEMPTSLRVDSYEMPTSLRVDSYEMSTLHALTKRNVNNQLVTGGPLFLINQVGLRSVGVLLGRSYVKGRRTFLNNDPQ